MPLPGAKLDIPHRPDSDDEDEDYVPPEEQDSDSETSEEENVAGGVAAVNTVIPVDEETKKREREALWASFQASVANPSKPPGSGVQPKRLVKIERRYRFAGEEVVEVVEVPEDSPDAKKWPLSKDPASAEKEAFAILHADTRICSVPEPAVISANTSSAAGTTQEFSGLATGVPSAATSQTATSSSTQPTGTKPPLKKPGPRKSKTTLGPIPGPAKAKKLTTLDKSAMDWKRHLDEAGSSVTDELEANRRAGGFLEKVEFLKRVEERKEENLDALKANKRRKL